MISLNKIEREDCARVSGSAESSKLWEGIACKALSRGSADVRLEAITEGRKGRLFLNAKGAQCRCESFVTFLNLFHRHRSGRALL